MKKRLLFIALMVAILTCFFVLGVSATTIYKDTNGTELFRYEVYTSSDEVTAANGFNLNGTRTTTCQHAGCAYNSSESAKPEAIGAIFTGFGISTRIENGSDVRGIAFTMLIDRELLTAYEENTGTALSYGVLTTFAQVIGTNNPLDNTGAPTLEKGIVTTNISDAEVYAVDLVIKGTKALWEEEAYELDLYMLGYTVENGNVTYMGTVNSVATASANVTDLKTTTYKEQIGE